MVVESGGKSGLIGRRSTVREAHEQRQIRAASLTFTSPVDMPKCAPWRACRPKSPQGKPYSPMLDSAPCGATGATWAAIRTLPALANSTPSAGALYIESNHRKTDALPGSRGRTRWARFPIGDRLDQPVKPITRREAWERLIGALPGPPGWLLSSDQAEESGTRRREGPLPQLDGVRGVSGG